MHILKQGGSMGAEIPVAPMFYISTQWLAIILSAVIVWLASTIIHMVLPHHKSDFKALPDEDGVINALNAKGLPPGAYNIPHCTSMDDAKKPEVLEKFNKGPVGIMYILDKGMPNIGKNVGLMFIYNLVIGVIVAYILSRTVSPGAEYLTVFRVAGVVSWLTYGMASIPDAIWYGRPWSNVIKLQFDALIYALLTAGVFAWQWKSLAGS